jgi:2-phosphoglycerate kinase
MIYLIGGTPRSGKTTVAKLLAKRLGISWVSCDSLEGIPKLYTPKNIYHKRFPKDIIRKETKNSNDLMYTRFNANQIVKACLTQGSSVWVAVEQFVEYLIGENLDYIVEGYQLPPKSVAKLKK